MLHELITSGAIRWKRQYPNDYLSNNALMFNLLPSFAVYFFFFHIFSLFFFWFSYFFPSHHHLTWDYEIHLHKNIIVVLSFHVIMTTHLLHPLIPSLSMSSTSLLNLVLFICCGKREILFRLHYLNIQTHTHTLTRQTIDSKCAADYINDWHEEKKIKK